MDATCDSAYEWGEDYIEEERSRSSSASYASVGFTVPASNLPMLPTIRAMSLLKRLGSANIWAIGQLTHR